MITSEQTAILEKLGPVPLTEKEFEVIKGIPTTLGFDVKEKLGSGFGSLVYALNSKSVVAVTKRLDVVIPGFEFACKSDMGVLRPPEIYKVDCITPEIGVIVMERFQGSSCTYWPTISQQQANTMIGFLCNNRETYSIYRIGENVRFNITLKNEQDPLVLLVNLESANFKHTREDIESFIETRTRWEQGVLRNGVSLIESWTPTGPSSHVVCCHLDMHQANIVGVPDGNITGVVDWEHVTIAPLVFELEAWSRNLAVNAWSHEVYNQALHQLSQNYGWSVKEILHHSSMRTAAYIIGTLMNKWKNNGHPENAEILRLAAVWNQFKTMDFFI